MYVSVVNQQVYNYPDDSPWEFEVDVESEYVPIFHRLFKQIDELEFRNFLRSHLPFMPYHFGRNNYNVDQRTMKIYALIHEFTDDSRSVYRKASVFSLKGLLSFATLVERT